MSASAPPPYPPNPPNSPYPAYPPGSSVPPGGPLPGGPVPPGAPIPGQPPYYTPPPTSTASGSDGHVVENDNPFAWQFSISDAGRRARSIHVFNSPVVYDIEASAPEADFDNPVTEFQDMVDTFVVNPPGTGG